MRTAIKIMLPVILAAPVLLTALGNAPARREDAGVVFSHKLHLDMGIECSNCHGKADSSLSGTDDLMPVRDNCLECHGEEDLKAWTTRADLPRMGRQVIDYSPKFNHSAHAKKEIACERCHAGLSQSDSSSTLHMPVMALCMSCHDGVQADKECSLCHEEPRGPRPADHKIPAWNKQHGDRARSDAVSCTMCHARNDCQECHQGDNLLPRAHPVGFEFNHPLEVRSQRTDCNVCHEDRAFCIECHTQRQIYPRSHQRAAWASTANHGGAHAVQARMNIEQCGACHEDDPSSQPVCAACHGK